MKLIVGLGNPGKKYEKTRHNIGFMVLDKLAADNKLTKWNKGAKAHALYLQLALDGQLIELLKPLTFINNSGHAVSYVAKKHNLRPTDIVVIHDDLDLPCGKIKISFGRSSAGHQGVQSIIENLKTKDFTRLRIGIAPLSAEKLQDTIRFVLQKFTNAEQKIIKDIMEKIIEAITAVVKFGPQLAMTQFN